MIGGSEGRSSYGLTQCPQCGSSLLPGRICPSCQVAWEPIQGTQPATAEPQGPPPLQQCPWCGGALQSGACFRCRVEWVPKRKAGPAAGAGGAVRPPATRPSPPKTTQTRGKTLLKKSLRWIPPVRLVWIFLGILILVGGVQSGHAATGAWAEILALAVGLDLLIQFGRFGRKLRFPDAALAIANFLTILVEPLNATIGTASTDFGVTILSVTAATIVIRHLLRQNGRPWFNPTALGLALGFVLFGVTGLPVPWGVGLWPGIAAFPGAPLPTPSKAWEASLMLVFGLALILRQRNTWRFPAFFFLAEAITQVIVDLLTGGASNLTLSNFALTAFSPLTVFFGLWMVSEPRTAPSAPKHMWRFALLVGVLYIALGALLANSSWSTIDPFVALFIGNGYAILSRRVRAKKPAKDSAPLSLAAAAPSRYNAFSSPMFYGGFEIVGAPGPNPPPAPGGAY